MGHVLAKAGSHQERSAARGRGRRLARRVIIAAVVVAQLTMIVIGYDSDHKTFGFQMFPEWSRWQAEIVRVECDGTRVPIGDDWEYRWSDLVRGRGLTNPFVEHHADSGLRNQFGYFQGALDWVAENISDYSPWVLIPAAVLLVLINGIAGPIVEEMYFRGYLLPRLERFDKWAPLINLSLFSLYHFWAPWQVFSRILWMPT